MGCFEPLEEWVDDEGVDDPHRVESVSDDDVIGHAVVTPPDRDREVHGEKDVQRVVEAREDHEREGRPHEGPHQAFDPIDGVRPRLHAVVRVPRLHKTTISHETGGEEDENGRRRERGRRRGEGEIDGSAKGGATSWAGMRRKA